MSFNLYFRAELRPQVGGCGNGQNCCFSHVLCQSSPASHVLASPSWAVRVMASAPLSALLTAYLGKKICCPLWGVEHPFCSKKIGQYWIHLCWITLWLVLFLALCCFSLILFLILNSARQEKLWLLFTVSRKRYLAAPCTKIDSCKGTLGASSNSR